MARSLDSSSRNFEVTKIFQRRVSSFEFPNKVCTPYHQPGLVPAPKSKVSKHGGENAKQSLASSFFAYLSTSWVLTWQRSVSLGVIGGQNA